jgi:hypothetical protein
MAKGNGYERIPNNWYKSPVPYTFPTFLSTDYSRLVAYDPRHLSMGGNTNGVNSFSGVDIGDLTGGVYNSANLLQGNNFACFYYRLLQNFVLQKLNDPVAGTLLQLGSHLGQVLDTVFGGLMQNGQSVSGCPGFPAKDIHSYSQWCGVSRQPGGIF